MGGVPDPPPEDDDARNPFRPTEARDGAQKPPHSNRGLGAATKTLADPGAHAAILELVLVRQGRRYLHPEGGAAAAKLRAAESLKRSGWPTDHAVSIAAGESDHYDDRSTHFVVLNTVGADALEAVATVRLIASEGGELPIFEVFPELRSAWADSHEVSQFISRSSDAARVLRAVIVAHLLDHDVRGVAVISPGLRRLLSRQGLVLRDIAGPRVGSPVGSRPLVAVEIDAPASSRDPAIAPLVELAQKRDWEGVIETATGVGHSASSSDARQRAPKASHGGRSIREARRERVLEAAGRLLGSVSFDWRKDLTYHLLASETGIDRSTISRDFGNKEQLIAALVDHWLDPENLNEFSEPWATELLEQATIRLLDPDVDLFDSLIEMARLDFEFARHEERLRSELAILGLAFDDSRTRDALKRRYQYYDNLRRAVWSELVRSLESAGIHARAGLSVAEVVTALTALLEGLAIRWHVDPDNVPDELFGRVFASIASGLFTAEDDAVASVRERLAEFDQLRRRS